MRMTTMATYNTYTAEQQEFLRDNSFGMSRQQLADSFNARYGTSKSVRAIKSYCNNRGWKSGHDSRFKTGHRSWQTGLSSEEFKSHYSDESFFRMLKPMAAVNKKWHVGDEVIAHGVPMIVTSEEFAVDFYSRLTPKRRYVWEQAHGTIPPGHRIIHLDGDRMNCDIENLYCIPDKFVPILNKNHWLTNEREHTLTAIKWCELFYALRGAKEA